MLAAFQSRGLRDHYAAFVVLIDTGMRPSELWRLKQKDVDLEHGLISIWQAKGNKPRSLPMTDRVVKTLRDRPCELVSGRLFPFYNRWFWTGWKQAQKDIGLVHDKSFIPYCLRHTCASRLIQRGATLASVQVWLGHRNIQTTLRYAHLKPDNLVDAMQLLQRKAV